MRVTILGTGYVGLVSAACFATLGAHVVALDADAEKIAALQQGHVPIYEPELADLVQEHLATGRLHFTTDLAVGLQQADLIFIAVGTPSRRGDGHADLAFVYQAARQIAVHLPADHPVTIVTKSTVPVGTGREVARLMRETNPQALFSVCANPEFLREGSAVQDCLNPERLVIGAEDERGAAMLRALYQPLLARGIPLVQTTLESAELSKYTSNAFLATKVAFINEIADLCERSGADVRVVAQAMGLDSRIGHKFLQAGPGFGGSCFPKDTLALARSAQERGIALPVVESVIASNRQRKQALAQRIIAACDGSVLDKTIAILGVTFKPNTDDMRDSPALDIIPALQEAGARIQAYDPAGMTIADAVLPDVIWATDAYAAMEQAHAVILLTDWPVFHTLDFAQLRQRVAAPFLIDLRNLYEAATVTAQGIRYCAIGLGDYALPTAR